MIDAIQVLFIMLGLVAGCVAGEMAFRAFVRLVFWRLEEARKFEVTMLTDGCDEPHSYFAEGWIDEAEFMAEVHRQELEDLDLHVVEWTQGPVKWAWGKWVQEDGRDGPTLKPAWPIPFWNFRYTMVMVP